MKRWKTLATAILAVVVLLPTALAYTSVPPQVRPHVHERVDTLPEITCSPWAWLDLEQASRYLLFERKAGEEMSGNATREDVLELAMNYLRASYQQQYLSQLIEHFLAEKDEQGNMKLLFQDKPDEPDRATDRASTIASYLGLAEGRSPGHFEPDALMTREEAATMLLRAYRVLDSDLPEPPESIPFRDAGAISDWAKDSVALLCDWGVLQGRDDGTFDPQGPITKEQCVLAFLRLYEKAPVSRIQGNVTPMFTYDQVMEVLESMIYVDSYRSVIERWEGPTATMLYEGTAYGVVSPRYTGFVYKDGRCRYFDIGLCTNMGVLTGNAKLTEGRFSPNGRQFFCTVTLEEPTKIRDNVVHPAGVYHITVDVETLEVTRKWEPFGEFSSAPFMGNFKYALSLQADSTLATVSGSFVDGSMIEGQDVKLAHAPFLKNGALYIPLEDVVTCLGGSCSVSGDTATVELFGHESIYRLGQTTMTMDGKEQVLSHFEFGPSEDEAEEPAPILEQGVFSIPLGSGFWSCTAMNVEAGSAVLGQGLMEDNSLAGIAFPSGTRVESIPLELTRGELDGILPEYELAVRQYTQGELTVYVQEALPGKEMPEAGNVCGVRFTDKEHTTPRGLNVGDSMDRAMFLYGTFTEIRDNLYRADHSLAGSYSLYVEVEGDTITAISLYDRFWGPNQLLEGREQPLF